MSTVNTLRSIFPKSTTLPTMPQSFTTGFPTLTPSLDPALIVVLHSFPRLEITPR